MTRVNGPGYDARMPQDKSAALANAQALTAKVESILGATVHGDAAALVPPELGALYDRLRALYERARGLPNDDQRRKDAIAPGRAAADAAADAAAGTSWWAKFKILGLTWATLHTASTVLVLWLAYKVFVEPRNRRDD